MGLTQSVGGDPRQIPQGFASAKRLESSLMSPGPLWMFWLNEPCTGDPSELSNLITHTSEKPLSPQGSSDGLRSWDATAARVCLTRVGLPLGSKFPLVLTALTCLGVPGLNAVGTGLHTATRRREILTLTLLAWYFVPHSWVGCSVIDVLTREPRGCGPPGVFSCPRCDADSFSRPFSLQLKKLLLSPSPPSCEAQRDGSVRRPGTPKSRPARPCTKVLPRARAAPASWELSRRMVGECGQLLGWARGREQAGADTCGAPLPLCCSLASAKLQTLC